MSRLRAVGIALAFGLLLATAGCLGFLTGSQPLAFAANETEVDDATLAETGYRLSASESLDRTLNVTVANQTRAVTLSSEVRTYNRTVTAAPGVEGDFARFSVYTTPAATVAGRSINPIGGRSPERLVRRLANSTGGSSDVEFESNRSVRFLDADRTVSVFGARQSVNGMETNVTVHFAMAAHDGDYVVAIAVHPARVDERSRVDALLEGLRHPAS